MGRKKISKRMKSIVLFAGNDSICFDLGKDEKIIMPKQQKNELIKLMKRKINYILKQKVDNTEKAPNPIQYDKLNFTQNEKDEEDSFPEISELPNNQVEMTSITMFINQYNEQPYEDQYINQLTHLFEINNQSQQ